MKPRAARVRLSLGFFLLFPSFNEVSFSLWLYFVVVCLMYAPTRTFEPLLMHKQRRREGMVFLS